jgi:hypothetical protein
MDDERLCQALWRRYYHAVNIDARHNSRLELRQLPRRYWRFLTEKQASARDERIEINVSSQGSEAGSTS